MDYDLDINYLNNLKDSIIDFLIICDYSCLDDNFLRKFYDVLGYLYYLSYKLEYGEELCL